MQLIFDNLVASLVGATIFMILATVSLRTKMAMIENDARYALQAKSLDFVFTLQRDMQGLSRIETISEEDSTFTFFSQTDQADTTKHRVEYRRTKVGSRDGIEMYQIQRWVAGAESGGSIGTITEWEIVGRNAEGGAITTTADARQLFVRFAAASPFAVELVEDVGLGDSQWEAVFRPPLLQGLTL